MTEAVKAPQIVDERQRLDDQRHLDQRHLDQRQLEDERQLEERRQGLGRSHRRVRIADRACPL